MTRRHLDDASKDAFVHYYRCQVCHHIWTIDKNDESKVTHVTPLKKERGKDDGNP